MQDLFGTNTQTQLVQAVRQQATGYLKTLVTMNGLPADVANIVFATIDKCMSAIVSKLTTEFNRGGQVQFSDIDRVIIEYTNMILNDLKQRQASGVGQYQHGTYGGISTMPLESPSLSSAAERRPEQSFSVPTVSNSTEPARSNIMTLETSANEARKFAFISDPNATQRSTARASSDSSKERSSIVDIVVKGVISSGDGNDYNYCSATCFIPEPALCRVIDHFVDTNDDIAVGNYIINLKYTRFILQTTGIRTSKIPIDLSPLKSNDRFKLPIANTIGKVVASIKDQSYNIANGIERILVKEFNDLIARYLRVDDDFGTILKLDYMSDIVELAGNKDLSYKEIAFHPRFEETVIRCFHEAINKVITDKTKLGYWNTCEILPDMITCPKFVMRANGLVERDLKINDESFIDAVECGFTAFAHNGSVVVSNFIPKDLESDLNGRAVRVTKLGTPFDFLILNMWKGEDITKTIVMRESPGRELIVKNGITLNGTPFIFKSSEDWGYGIS